MWASGSAVSLIQLECVRVSMHAWHSPIQPIACWVGPAVGEFPPVWPPPVPAAHTASARPRSVASVQHIALHPCASRLPIPVWRGFEAKRVVCFSSHARCAQPRATSIIASASPRLATTQQRVKQGCGGYLATVAVPHGHFEASLEEVGGHRCPHDPESNEAHVHRSRIEKSTSSNSFVKWART